MICLDIFKNVYKFWVFPVDSTFCTILGVCFCSICTICCFRSFLACRVPAGLLRRFPPFHEFPPAVFACGPWRAFSGPSAGLPVHGLRSDSVMQCDTFRVISLYAPGMGPRFNFFTADVFLYSLKICVKSAKVYKFTRFLKLGVSHVFRNFSGNCIHNRELCDCIHAYIA